jgi:hypothetical protein
VSGSLGVLSGSKFWAYDPSKGKPHDGLSYWSGFSIGVGKSLSLTKSNSAKTSGNIMSKLGSLSGNAQIQYYYLLHGNGSDYLPTCKKDVSG